MKYLYISIILTLAQVSQPAKIFCIFPAPSYSHQQPLLALTRALAAKGHDLTVITPNPSKEPIKNHREIDVSESYNVFKKAAAEHNVSMQGRIPPEKMQFNLLGHLITLITSYQLEMPVLQELIKDFRANPTTYDLILYEEFGFNAFLGFSELLGNPPTVGVVTISPLHFMDVESGNPVNPASVPSIFYPYSDRMSFLERATNLVSLIRECYYNEFYLKPSQEAVMKKHFGNLKHTAEEISRNRSILIVSQDLSTGYPKPSHPNTAYVGPLHVQKPAPLPQDIKRWLDEAGEGVIYFSLGSNMKGTSVPAEIRSAFIKAFSQFPKVRVLWKWESDEKLPGQPDNVMTRKWIPQQAVLAHKNTKLFITQAGLQSIQEAINYGVPILGCPMFADQDYNARKLVDSGAGLVVEFREITYEKLYYNIKELLMNQRFKENVMRLSNISKDKLMPPVETAVWWVEYVLRHNGAPHLRPASLDLTWYQYFFVDIIVAVLMATTLTLFTIYSVIKLILSMFLYKKVKIN